MGFWTILVLNGASIISITMAGLLFLDHNIYGWAMLAVAILLSTSYKVTKTHVTEDDSPAQKED